MKKNVASQVIGAQLVSATDGSAFTGAVTVSVTGDGGTQATGSVGSGACTHEGNGFHTYSPSQAETNYDHIAFTFTGTGAIPVTVQVYPTFPQTGDSYARLGSPAGASVSADIADIPTVAELEARTLATADYATAAALATVDSNVDAILVDTGTDLPATLSTIQTAVATIDTVVNGISTEVSKIPRLGTTYKHTNQDTAATADVTIGAAS